MNRTHERIKEALKEKGLTQVKIAELLNVKPASVHNVITEKRKTPRIRAALSLATGIPLNELWPDVQKKEKMRSPSPGRN